MKDDGSDAAPRTALVVEDDALIAMALADLLETLGFAATEASTAAAADTLLAAQAFDVVLVDLGLPDRPGTALVRDIYAATPMQPVIIASGATAEADIPAGARVALLQKPFSRDQLSATLRELGLSPAL